MYHLGFRGRGGGFRGRGNGFRGRGRGRGRYFRGARQGNRGDSNDDVRNQSILSDLFFNYFLYISKLI